MSLTFYIITFIIAALAFLGWLSQKYTTPQATAKAVAVEYARRVKRGLNHDQALVKVLQSRRWGRIPDEFFEWIVSQLNTTEYISQFIFISERFNLRFQYDRLAKESKEVRPTILVDQIARAGYTYVARKQLEEAGVAFVLGLKIEANSVPANLGIATTLFLKDRFLDAMPFFEVGIKGMKFQNEVLDMARSVSDSNMKDRLNSMLGDKSSADFYVAFHESMYEICKSSTQDKDRSRYPKFEL